VRKDGQPIDRDIIVSSDSGDQICCDPRYEEGFCDNYDESNEYVCSEPAEYTGDPSYSYFDILNNVDGTYINHQMFAFCQGTKHETCIPDSSNPESIDMLLQAGEESTEISIEDLRFV
jgi:hypothetical protein